MKTEGVSQLASQPTEKKKKVLVIVSSLLAFFLIVGLVLGMGKIRRFLGGATGGFKPEGVRVINITANSATVTWQTSKPVAAQVEYGTTPGSFLLRTFEKGETTNHNLTLSPLLPETIYYFRIRVGDEVYDDNGAPFSFTTKSSQSSPGSSPKIQKPVPSFTPTPSVKVTPQPTASLSATPASTATSSASKKYTQEDFIAKFGQSDEEFDINGDGIVNSADWILYQSQQ